MTIQATPKNIEWLAGRLYEIRRVLQSSAIPFGDTPAFILLTKNEDDRHKAEKIFYHYFFTKYGVDALDDVPIVDSNSQRITAFAIPESGCRVVLMDI